MEVVSVAVVLVAVVLEVEGVVMALVAAKGVQGTVASGV